MTETSREARYGEDWAPVYDEWFPFDEQGETAVETLAELAGSGRVLELAIGTGRLALPLARRGIHVEGVDASESMIARLRAKPGGEAIPVTLGNFRDVPVSGEFDLVFIVFNTIFALLSQAEQVECVANVAARLAPSGRFVLECFVPDHRRLAPNGQKVQPVLISDEETRFHLLQHDPVNQRLDSQTIRITRDGGVSSFPVHTRYAWPSELDLMARLAGLRLQHRWGGWNREPFTAESTKHVSVYQQTG